MINSLTGGLEFPTQKLTALTDDNSDCEDDEDFDDINSNFNPVISSLPIEEKIKLVKEVGEEIIGEDELVNLFKTKQAPICYDGFEPSGRMHIAQGILRCINVNRLTKAGCIFFFWVADWFAQMNNKMGGDLNKIRIVGKYFIEIWKAAGMDLRNVKFLWASEEISKRANEYWSMVIDVARKNSVDRIVRCGQIMGRSDKETLQAAQIMYPCMQCTDIFYLKADMCSLGVDQRKVNVLAREYCDDIGKKEKPIIVSHHMIAGLTKDSLKMSKSLAGSAIFMEDSKEEVEWKVKESYCPEKTVEHNPVMEYCKYLIFPKLGKFVLLRDQKFGGDAIYEQYEDLEKDYIAGIIHPNDLKPSVANHINEMIEPVRQHFINDPDARRILELVKSFSITR